MTLETFSNRFYKDLDDTVLVGDMAEHDVIVCFELPCHAQQSRTWKPDPDPSKNPLIVPVHMCTELNTHSSFGRGVNAFTHPFVVVLDSEQVKHQEDIYAAVVARLQRWAKDAGKMYEIEHSIPMEEVRFSSARGTTTVTEIKENGDVVTVQEEASEEDDIADARAMILEEDPVDMDVENMVTDRARPKPGMFNMHIQIGHERFGTGSQWSTTQRWEKWENRRGRNEGDEPPLLREGDALFCEWNNSNRAEYLGDDRSNDHSRWDEKGWEEFVHPEFKASQRAALEKKSRGITLQDCLEEFTKEEQLGEDDLWYCPRCKKHQQATKKFDIWTVPDILVVHLKRFSNSRVLRDKIDAFVEFPVDGLDLESFCGEREVTKRLAAGGQPSGITLSDIDEPMVYDLYAVDEHLGGLGGGHYRAYAKVHQTGKWYHFDDSYVNPAQATDAVVSCISPLNLLETHFGNMQNANAYLLFYKRRTNRPIGGKTYEKVEAARQSVPLEEDTGTQLPTPPDEDSPHSTGIGLSRLSDHAKEKDNYNSFLTPEIERYLTPLTNSRSTPDASPPPLDEVDPPGFEDSQYDELVDHQPSALSLASHHYDFPDPSSTSSPSSVEAEPDLDEAFPNELLTLTNHSIDWDPDAVARLGDNGFGRPLQNTSVGHSFGFGQSWHQAADQKQWSTDQDQPHPGESDLLDIDL